MITNPPNIITILRAHAGLIRHGVRGDGLVTALSLLFRQHLGPLPWEDFLGVRHLYLQSIPRETCQAAWGLATIENHP